jgi:hypothetical protein
MPEPKVEEYRGIRIACVSDILTGIHTAYFELPAITPDLAHMVRYKYRRSPGRYFEQHDSCAGAIEKAKSVIDEHLNE